MTESAPNLSFEPPTGPPVSEVPVNPAAQPEAPGLIASVPGFERSPAEIAQRMVVGPTASPEVSPLGSRENPVVVTGGPADPTKVLGHPSNPMSGIGEAYAKSTGRPPLQPSDKRL